MATFENDTFGITECEKNEQKTCPICGTDVCKCSPPAMRTEETIREELEEFEELYDWYNLRNMLDAEAEGEEELTPEQLEDAKETISQIEQNVGRRTLEFETCWCCVFGKRDALLWVLNEEDEI